MEKLLFEFTLKPSNDGKSNIYCINSITANDRVYLIPEILQPVVFHTSIVGTNTFAKVRKSLSKRYQIRRVWITLTDEQKKIYIDEDGNMQFEGEFLEELNEEKINTEKQKEISNFEKLVEKLLENKQENKEESMKDVAERFVIEKFKSNNTNANRWIDIFEKECIRLNVTTDVKKIEILYIHLYIYGQKLCRLVQFHDDKINNECGMDNMERKIL